MLEPRFKSSSFGLHSSISAQSSSTYINSGDAQLLGDQGGGRWGGVGGEMVLRSQLISIPYFGEDALLSCLMS